MSQNTNIEAYLDTLTGLLTLPPQRVRRIAIEVEDHLRASTQALIDEGASPDEAEQQAIERFGRPDVVARSFAAAPIAWLAVVRSAIGSLYGVAVLGLIAIGCSGLLALALSAPFGKDFVAGDAPGVTYTAARCADYFRLEPNQTDCNQAAIAHHFGEVVDYRVAAGVLGLLMLGGSLLYTRGKKNTRDALPPLIVPTIGTSLFGVAALALLFMSGGGTGQAGAMLSGAIVSAVVAIWYGLRLTRLLTPWVMARD